MYYFVEGIIVVVTNEEHPLDVTRFNCEKQFVMDENELLDRFVTLVEKWDPDIFVGYEVSEIDAYRNLRSNVSTLV